MTILPHEVIWHVERDCEVCYWAREAESLTVERDSADLDEDWDWEVVRQHEAYYWAQTSLNVEREKDLNEDWEVVRHERIDLFQGLFLGRGQSLCGVWVS